jgi:hypothetical protein
VDDDADIAADTNGGEALVFGFVELVELQAGMGGVQLEIEGRGFDGFLLLVSCYLAEPLRLSRLRGGAGFSLSSGAAPAALPSSMPSMQLLHRAP